MITFSISNLLFVTDELLLLCANVGGAVGAEL